MISLSSITNVILNLIFPVSCLGCGAEDVWYCDQCIATVPLQEKSLSTALPLDQLYAATHYHHAQVQLLIHQLKYNGIRHCADPLAAIVVRRFQLIDRLNPDTVGSNDSATAVMPVPLHTKRFRDRGFNQSAVIGRLVANALGLSYRDDILRRVQWTHPQAQLDHHGRQENVRDAFAVLQPFKKPIKNVILIDDVATTASTLCACARVLKDAGVQNVIGLVVASDRIDKHST